MQPLHPSAWHYVTNLAGASLLLHLVHGAQQLGLLLGHVPWHIDRGDASVLQHGHMRELRPW